MDRRDLIASAIRGEAVGDERPWDALPDADKSGWREDADRVIALLAMLDAEKCIKTSKLSTLLDQKFTAAPWHVSDANAYASTRPVDIISGFALVAQTCVLPNRMEEKANARLIAAAPDMLEALTLAAGHLDEMRKDAKWHPVGHCPVLDRVHRAIAKAQMPNAQNSKMHPMEPRPRGSNADQWVLWLQDHADWGVPYKAVQIAEAIDEQVAAARAILVDLLEATDSSTPLAEERKRLPAILEAARDFVSRTRARPALAEPSSN